jgi:2-methylcitrate dehydratase PrpD
LAGRGGNKQVAEARHFKGHAKRPLSDEEIEKKFQGLARKVLLPGRIRGILRKAWALDELPDVGELLALFDYRPQPGDEVTE